MTATEELRRMLDERGVEWHGDIATYWGGADAVESLFADNALDVSLYAISPEQAIEATLGRETCEVESMHGYTDPYTTTRYVVELSCHTLDDWPESEPPAYCPWCGAKVVGDASVD